jgi:hypothetical protein
MKVKKSIENMSWEEILALPAEHLSKKKPTRGGARKGAGRPVVAKGDKMMRIPFPCVKQVEKLIKPYKQPYKGSLIKTKTK